MAAAPEPDINALIVEAAGHLTVAAGNVAAASLGMTGTVASVADITGMFGTGPGVLAGPTRRAVRGPVPATTGATRRRPAGPVTSSGITAPATTVPSPRTTTRTGPSLLSRALRVAKSALSTPAAGTPGVGIRLPSFPLQPAGLKPSKPTDGSIVGLFVVWKGKVLIQYRKIAPEGVSCISGTLDGDKSFEETAVRELEEEAQLAPAPAPDTLTLFHQTKIADASGKLVIVEFYYVRIADDIPVIVKGASAAYEGEVNRTVDFADVAGAENIEGTGHAWILPVALDKYAEAHVAENPLFAEAVDKFMNVLDAVMGVEMGDVNLSADVPAWVPPSYFDRSTNVPTECVGSFIGPDCLGKAVLRDIMAAEQFKKSLRLRVNPDGALRSYNEKAAELATLQSITGPTDEQKVRTEELERELATGYPDRLVRIRGSDGEIHQMTVSNPYKALAYREDRRNPVNFADPAGYRPTKNDPDGLMYGRNVRLLQELAPKELIADSAMSTALLESLWFCGSNPTLSNDPRCYPARVLGELREWHDNKVQARTHEVAAEALKDTSWGVTKQIMAALENAKAGGSVYPFIEMRMGVPSKKTVTKDAPPVVDPEEDEEDEDATSPPFTLGATGGGATGAGPPMPGVTGGGVTGGGVTGGGVTGGGVTGGGATGAGSPLAIIGAGSATGAASIRPAVAAAGGVVGVIPSPV